MLTQDLLAECGVDIDLEEAISGKKFQISCPFAEWTHEKTIDSHPSAVIATSKKTGELYFHCFTCKISGSLADFIYDYADYSQNQRLLSASLKIFPELNTPHIIQLTKLKNRLLTGGIPKDVVESRDHRKEFEKQCDIIMRGSRAAKYLKSRKIEGSVAHSFGLRYDKESKRVVLPVYDRTGKLLTAVGRALLGDTLPKYYNYYTAPTGTVLGGIQRFKEHSRVVLVEGFFDMLNLARLSDNILPLCCFGARLTDEQAKLISYLYYRRTNNPKFKITLMYDGDTAGSSAVSPAVKKLKYHHIPLSSIDIAWLRSGEDPGSLSLSQYQNYLERAQTCQPRKHARQTTASNLSQQLKRLQHG